MSELRGMNRREDERNVRFRGVEDESFGLGDHLVEVYVVVRRKSW